MRSTVDVASKPIPGSARTALRLATASHHERIDRLFSRPDLTTGTGYRRFLSAQARAHLSVEAALTRAGAARVVEDWPARRRESHLLADFAALDFHPPMNRIAIEFDSDEAVLGGVYVLEGSRIGGALLKRHVSPALPSIFLGASDPVAWRSLLATLEARLVTPAQRDAAIAAAVNVFEVFEVSAAAL